MSNLKNLVIVPFNELNKPFRELLPKYFIEDDARAHLATFVLENGKTVLLPVTNKNGFVWDREAIEELIVVLQESLNTVTTKEIHSYNDVQFSNQYKSKV